MSVLDFFSESLGVVVKVTAALKSCFDELEGVLKPHDNMFASTLEATVLSNALKLYRQTQSFLIGAETETKGHEFIEDETIVGSSDNMIFYMKELVAELAGCKKAALNPFIVSKLDIPSIKLFNYPPDAKSKDNPYKMRT